MYGGCSGQITDDARNTINIHSKVHTGASRAALFESKKKTRRREREKEQNIYHKFHNQLMVVVVAAERTEREKGKRLAFEQIKEKKQNQIGVSEYINRYVY